ncbi:MAG TPA: hypothetical protein VFN23_02165 [Ktedonobacteraceae bacterium]|nr:hypothetical protein [Ktedonobacteraceae bacterium]
MTPESLLFELEKLPFSGRLRRVIELGKQADSDANIRETLVALSQGDTYQRFLATEACYGSRDSAQVLQALADPSLLIRKTAIGLVILACNPAETQQALELLAPDAKKVLLNDLARNKKQAEIDLYLETLAARHDPNFRRLLPFGSQAVVDRYFEQEHERFELGTWRRLARVHPGLVVEYLRNQALNRQMIDHQRIDQINEILPQLTKKDPDLTLELVRSLLQSVPLSRLNLRYLAKERPNQVADLLLQTEEQSTLQFGGLAHRLDTERLIALFQRFPANIHAKRFAELRPEQRLALYNVCGRGWRNGDGVLHVDIVAALPREQRQQEARRNLALPILATRPVARLPYAAFLPWDEARGVLDNFLNSPNAELRGAAINALIGTARYQRERLAELLQLVHARRNEQDPVRQPMLAALEALPHGIWQVEHLEILGQIVRDALNATDLSAGSQRAMGRIVVHLFKFHSVWSAEQMAIIYRERGYIDSIQFERYLSNADVRQIAPLLMPILRSWQQREYEILLNFLATALGKRLPVFNELCDLLEEMLAQTLKKEVADSVLGLFLKYRRSQVYLLIPRLLQQDPSTILLSSVYTYLHQYRQDLLTPFLGSYSPKGRFSTGNVSFVFPLFTGYQRWTPTQQKVFAQTLLTITDPKDKNRMSRELRNAIQRMAVMPFLDFSPLIRLASDERQGIRDDALRALGRLDARQGIPTLFEALGDERARIAIYALRKAFLTMSPENALALLQQAPMARVTVAKEVVRLIGELKTEEAYQELRTLERGDLHRDVRIALLRAFWDYRDRVEPWDIFRSAALSSDRAVAQGVVRVPTDGLTPALQKRLAELTALLLSHPQTEVRLATLEWRSEHPVSDIDLVLFPRLLALMNSPYPDECKLASKEVFLTYTGEAASAIGEAIREVLPNRRALQSTVSSFFPCVRSNRAYFVPTTREVLKVLREDPVTIFLQLQLIMLGLPVNEIVGELQKVIDRFPMSPLWSIERPLLEIKVTEAELEDLERSLAPNENDAVRRLAVFALAAQAKRATGWTDERIRRLERFREDPSPIVAATAQFTFVS